MTISYNLEPLLSGANREIGQTVSFVGISVGNGGVVAHPNPPLSRRIDIVGDSITAGSGYDKLEAIGDPLSLGTACQPWAPIVGNSQNYNWETYAARSLRANATTIAWSGKGLIYNSGCHAGPTLPILYNRTFATQSEGEPWDFTRTSRPDAVLIYLGTNDFSCSSTTPAAFTGALVSFMINITALYSASPGPVNTTFFLAIGPMSPVLPFEPIVAAVDAAQALGMRASLLDLRGNASMPVALDGCGGHPGPFGHWRMAGLAVAQIKAVMGW